MTLAEVDACTQYSTDFEAWILKDGETTWSKTNFTLGSEKKLDRFGILSKFSDTEIALKTVQIEIQSSSKIIFVKKGEDPNT